ncbi:MAG: aspartate aminotransferase family protein [Candidatus Hinthialibacter antarcticus]|nr:aspartate aminotransferase family protein [Candidatus Hinthialibacter antarcticus]
MTTASLSAADAAAAVLSNNYGHRDLCLVRGEGAQVWDNTGRRYTDLLSGLGVNNLGHCHPRVVAAIQKQAETLLHVSNLYLIEPQIELARLLVEHSGADKAFFCNSGAEAVEAGIKLSRRYSKEKHGEGKHKIVALQNSFHGRTMGALAATGQEKYHQGFEPLLEGFVHVPINDVEALTNAVDASTCAVLFEPVQGEGGIHPVSVEFAQEARRLCDKTGALLIFDEVQCGLGRAGHLFASEEFGVEPDLIALAKSLAGGVPMGALLMKDHAAELLTPGTHASTFGGNPLAAAAGVAAFLTIIDDNLAERSKRLGEMFRAQLNLMKTKHACIKEVRGRGLMIGVEMTGPVAGLLSKLRERGYLAGSAGPNVLRFLPPLIVNEDLLLGVLPALDDCLTVSLENHS